MNNIIVDPSHWDEVSPLIGGFALRPYADLQADPDYALPGFYAGERGGRPVLAFQPGWDGQDGEDAIHWYGLPRPTVVRVRDTIASSLVSSWLVQDRDDAARFFLGDEPGSIITPWGIIPPHVIFARRPNPDDAPWENLAAVLDDVDAALASGAPTHGGFVDWRLRNAVSPSLKIDIHRNPDDAIVAVFRQQGADDDVIVFLWNADGSPRDGEVQEYERGAIGLYDTYPLPSEADLESFLAGVVA